VIPTRRGYPGGPEAERTDFDLDAEDLLGLIGAGAHLVGFSYGGIGCAIAAAAAPDRIRSLTLIESPIYKAAPDDPRVREIIVSGDAVLASEADEETERRFLANARMDPDATTGRHRELVQQAIRAARGGRSPSEANPDLDAIADAGLPVMIVSGGHHDGIEMICDGLASHLHARREILPGAGHAVPRAPRFNQVLEDFLRSTGR
jgi:pimeloyl-ACP methyl ester carboxylesterase